MKKTNLFYLLGLFLCFALTTACSDDDSSDETYFEVLQGDTSFDATGAETWLGLSTSYKMADLVAFSNDEWITDVSIASYRLSFTVNQNGTNDDRTGVIYVSTGKAIETVEITQTGSPFTLPGDQYFTSDGGTFTIPYSASELATVSIPVADDWASAEVSSSSITVTVAENKTADIRYTTVTLYCEGITSTVYVEQEAGDGSAFTMDAIFSTSTISAGKISGQVELTASYAAITALNKAGYVYTLTPSVDWITATAPSDVSQPAIFECTENTTGSSRSGEIVVKVDGTSIQTLTLTQSMIGYNWLLGDWTLHYMTYNNSDSLTMTITLTERKNGKSYYFEGLGYAAQPVAFYSESDDTDLVTVYMQSNESTSWYYDETYNYANGYTWNLCFGYSNAFYYYLTTYADYFGYWGYVWTFNGDHSSPILEFSRNTGAEYSASYLKGFQLDVRLTTSDTSYTKYARYSYLSHLYR